MMSNDFIIRNDRNVIDVVVSLEGEVKLLRREFEEFKQETRSELKSVRQEMNVQSLTLQGDFKQLAGEVRGLNRTVDTMTTMFSWGFALVAIAAAAAPLLRDWFTIRRENRDIDRRIEQKIDEILSRRIN